MHTGQHDGEEEEVAWESGVMCSTLVHREVVAGAAEPFLGSSETTVFSGSAAFWRLLRLRYPHHVRCLERRSLVVAILLSVHNV